MGKRSGPAPPPVVMPQPVDNSAEMVGGMMAMISSMQNSFAQQTQAMMANAAPPPLPEVSPIKAIDWEAKRKDLNEKVEKEVTSEAARMKGRSSTKLVKNLLEDDDPDIVSLELLGSN